MVRRVVTGEAADGKSIVVRDEQLEPITVSALRGAEFHRLWGGDAIPRLPANGETHCPPTYYPAVGGFRFVIVTLGPDRITLPADLDLKSAAAEIREKLPGAAEVLELDNPGMHRTDTVDLGLVLSGEIWLELDDGAELRFQAGDSVIQNGARHAWRNKSSEPCVMLFAFIGARRAA